MKKLIALALLVALCVGGMSGCENKPTAPAKPTGGAATPPKG